jgi:hypothetical protein
MADKNDALRRVAPITMTPQDLQNFRPQANHVLLKQHSDNTIIKFNDTSLTIDPNWKPEFHVDRVFTVVALPASLTIDKSEYSMNWITDIQLKVGDRVWINYLHSIKPIMRIECQGDKYIVLHYQFIYLTVRDWNPEDYNAHIIVPSALMQDNIKLSKDGATVFHPPMIKFQIELMDDEDNSVSIPPNVVTQTVDVVNNKVYSWEAGHRQKATFLSEIIMLNGYILFEPDKLEAFSHLISSKARSSYGTLRFYGLPNRRYKEKEYCDDNYLVSSQRIFLKFSQFPTLEDPVHALFPWPVPLCVTQRRHVYCVVDPNKKPVQIQEYEP